MHEKPLTPKDEGEEKKEEKKKTSRFKLVGSDVLKVDAFEIWIEVLENNCCVRFRNGKVASSSDNYYIQVVTCGSSQVDTYGFVFILFHLNFKLPNMIFGIIIQTVLMLRIFQVVLMEERAWIH